MSDLGDAVGWATNLFDRLSDAFDEFGIPRPDGSERPGVWFDLAMRLMIEREPSLSPVQKKPGAPRQSKTVVQDILILHALGPGRKPGKSVSAAALHLAKNPRFNGRTAGYIRKRFYVLQRPMSPEGRRVREQLAFMQKNL